MDDNYGDRPRVFVKRIDGLTAGPTREVTDEVRELRDVSAVERDAMKARAQERKRQQELAAAKLREELS